MTGTIRNHFSRACNKRVNHEKEWKRRRTVDTSCETWCVRPGAFRREFDYSHSSQSHLPVRRHRQSRRSASAKKRLQRHRERGDKWRKWEDELQEDTSELPATTTDQAEIIEPDKESPTNLTTEMDEDYALVMKFGSATVRLPNTYSYNNPLYETGECLVRYIFGRWLVLPCDLVMDDLSYLYSPYAWEDGSIGFLTDVILPAEPLCDNIQGSYLNWLIADC